MDTPNSNNQPNPNGERLSDILSRIGKYVEAREPEPTQTQRIPQLEAQPDEQPNLPLAVPSFRLARYAGKQWSDKTHKEIREWLKRMTLTGIEGAIYRAKKKNYDDGFVGTVFSQVVTKGETMRNGKSADTNYVWLAPWFLSNYYYRLTRPVDFTFYKQLRKPIAKSLYALLENGWYAGDGRPFSKSYKSICDEFLLARYQHLSKI